MSFIGFEIWLCSNGHKHTFDCYETPDMDTWKCSCGGDILWWILVDETNESAEEAPLLELTKEEVTETCPTCGHVKVTEPAQYKPSCVEDGWHHI